MAVNLSGLMFFAATVLQQEVFALAGSIRTERVFILLLQLVLCNSSSERNEHGDEKNRAEGDVPV